MSTALGIRLNIQSTTDGVGFVNPHPLPAFPSGMQALHLLRRSATFSSYNRVTQLPEGVTSAGVEFRDTEVYTANASQQLLLDGPAVDLTNFTIALAARLRSPASDESERTTLIASSDWTSDSNGKGFRLNLRESSIYQLAIYSRVYTEGQVWVANISFDLPPEPDRYVLMFYSFNGTDVVFTIPGANRTANVTQEEHPEGQDPDPDPTWVMGESFPSGRPGDMTDIGYSAFAQWSRALSSGEIEDAHTGLKQWGDFFDLDFY